MARQLFRAGAITVAKDPVMVKEHIGRAEGLVVKFGAAGFTSS